MKPGSNPRDRPGARWWNAPRSSWNASPFAGRCGKRKPQWWLTPRSRGVDARCEQNAREVPPLVAVLARRKRCAVTGSRRGFCRPNDGANLHSIRSGPRRAYLFGGARCEARQPVPSPQGGGRRRRRREVRHLALQNEESKQLAVGARASSYCRSRQNVLGLREARHQSRSGRKPGRYPERVNGSLTIGGRSGAQAQEPTGGKRGADHRELGDPHHVSAASSMKAAWFRSCFGASGMRAATVGGRHPGSEKRTPFTRRPRNRSWRPPSHSVGTA